MGNIFACWEANFVSATMFPEVGKQGKIDRRHNVSATMFPSLLRALITASSEFLLCKIFTKTVCRLRLSDYKPTFASLLSEYRPYNHFAFGI